MRETNNTSARQELVKEVQKADMQGDLAKQKEWNQKLRLRSIEQQDEAGLLISDFYKCSELFDLIDFDQCEKELEILIEKLKGKGLDLYLLRSYNLLAIIVSEQSNYFSCLHYYLQAQHIADLHPEYQYNCILSNNIGKLFVDLKEYDSALPLFLKAYEYHFQEHNDNPDVLATITLNTMACYSNLNQFEECEAWAKKADEFDEDAKRVVLGILLSNAIIKAYQENDVEHVQRAMKTLMETASADDPYIYFFRLYLRLLKVSLERKDQHHCDELMKVMDDLNSQKPKGTIIANYMYEYASLKVAYHQQFQRMHHDHMDAAVLLNDYYLYSTRIVDQLQKAYTHSMVVQLEKEKVELDNLTILRENELLEKNIQLDVFTQIYNKISIETHVNDCLKAGVAHRKHALLVLDIDFFKRVNDTYGHKVGDQVLLDVVTLLRSMIRDNVLVGRFGGDEFIIFLSDYKDQTDLEAFAEDIVSKGRQIGIPNASREHITFSIGISTAKEIDDFEAMFHNADKALYDRKHHGRDGYTLFDS